MEEWDSIFCFFLEGRRGGGKEEERVSFFAQGGAQSFMEEKKESIISECFKNLSGSSSGHAGVTDLLLKAQSQRRGKAEKGKGRGPRLSYRSQPLHLVWQTEV